MTLEENKSQPNTTTQSGPKVEAAKAEAPKSAPKPLKPKKGSAFQAVLKQIGLALLFLVIGALGVLLALYLPASKDLKTAQSELERLVPIETQYAALQQSSTKMEQQALVYKLMSETSALKNALNEGDGNKTSQYLTYVKEDLGKLTLTDFPNLPASLSAQFQKIQTSITSTPTSAVSEVDKFYNSLLTLSDNL